MATSATLEKDLVDAATQFEADVDVVHRFVSGGVDETITVGSLNLSTMAKLTADVAAGAIPAESLTNDLFVGGTLNHSKFDSSTVSRLLPEVSSDDEGKALVVDTAGAFALMSAAGNLINVTRVLPNGGNEYGSNIPFTFDSRTRSATVLLMGAGGAGGQDSNNNNYGACGGGSGAMALVRLMRKSMNDALSEIAVTIGQGPLNSGSGGASSFGSIVTCGGGTAGAAATSSPQPGQGGTLPSDLDDTDEWQVQLVLAANAAGAAGEFNQSRASGGRGGGLFPAPASMFGQNNSGLRSGYGTGGGGGANSSLPSRAGHGLCIVWEYQ